MNIFDASNPDTYLTYIQNHPNLYILFNQYSGLSDSKYTIKNKNYLVIENHIKFNELINIIKGLGIHYSIDELWDTDYRMPVHSGYLLTFNDDLNSRVGW